MNKKERNFISCYYSKKTFDIQEFEKIKNVLEICDLGFDEETTRKCVAFYLAMNSDQSIRKIDTLPKELKSEIFESVYCSSQEHVVASDFARNYWKTLPIELTIHIFNYSNIRTQCIASRTCKTFREAFRRSFKYIGDISMIASSLAWRTYVHLLHFSGSGKT